VPPGLPIFVVSGDRSLRGFGPTRFTECAAPLWDLDTLLTPQIADCRRDF
jgi:hypothetical protein